MDSLSSSRIGLFLFSLPGSVLGDWIFLWICPFLQGYPLYWHMVHSNLLQYCISLSVTASFSFLILLTCTPPPPHTHPAFGYESGSRFINFFIFFSKNQLLVSVIFSRFFSLGPYFICFCADLWFLSFFKFWVLPVVFPIPLV